MTLALQTYPDNTDYVNKIINNIASQLNSTALASDEIVDMLKRLLLVPLESYNNVLTVLKLEKYGDIIHSLGYEQRKFIALSIVLLMFVVRLVFFVVVVVASERKFFVGSRLDR